LARRLLYHQVRHEAAKILNMIIKSKSNQSASAMQLLARKHPKEYAKLVRLQNQYHADLAAYNKAHRHSELDFDFSDWYKFHYRLKKEFAENVAAI
jgi:hypothetical protein